MLKSSTFSTIYRSVQNKQKRDSCIQTACLQLRDHLFLLVSIIWQLTIKYSFKHYIVQRYLNLPLCKRCCSLYKIHIINIQVLKSQWRIALFLNAISTTNMIYWEAPLRFHFLFKSIFKLHKNLNFFFVDKPVNHIILNGLLTGIHQISLD